MVKDFLLGILSFTFFDVLIFIPSLAYFSSREESRYSDAVIFIWGMLTGTALRLPYFLSVLLVFFALKEFGILKRQATLKRKREYACVFLFGIIFSVFINKPFIETAGLSIPLFLSVCILHGTGISRTACGVILTFYGIFFPLLKILGVI